MIYYLILVIQLKCYKSIVTGKIRRNPFFHRKQLTLVKKIAEKSNNDRINTALIKILFKKL